MFHSASLGDAQAFPAFFGAFGFFSIYEVSGVTCRFYTLLPKVGRALARGFLFLFRFF